jgi:hypothetical protein
LESIGFRFKCGPTKKPWDERLQELVDFKKITGHTNVPQRWKKFMDDHQERRLVGKHWILF